MRLQSFLNARQSNTTGTRALKAVAAGQMPLSTHLELHRGVCIFTCSCVIPSNLCSNRHRHRHLSIRPADYLSMESEDDLESKAWHLRNYGTRICVSDDTPEFPDAAQFLTCIQKRRFCSCTYSSRPKFDGYPRSNMYVTSKSELNGHN